MNQSMTRTKPTGAKRARLRKNKKKGSSVFSVTGLGRCNFRKDPLRSWLQLVGALTRPLSPKPFAVFRQDSLSALLFGDHAILLADLICLFRRHPHPNETSVKGVAVDELSAGIQWVGWVGLSVELYRVSLSALCACWGWLVTQRLEVNVEKEQRGERAWKGCHANQMTSAGGVEGWKDPMLVASGNFLCLPHC